MANFRINAFFHQGKVSLKKICNENFAMFDRINAQKSVVKSKRPESGNQRVKNCARDLLMCK